MSDLTSNKRVSDQVLASFIDEYREGCELHLMLSELRDRRAADEPTSPPVAWRKALDPQYDYSDRYRYRDETGIGAAPGWEPLYAEPRRPPSPPSGDLEVHTVNTKTDPRSKRCFEGECARTACTNRPAVFFNRSTLWYYCESCAVQINRYAQEQLCTLAAGGAEAIARAEVTKVAPPGDRCGECDQPLPPVSEWSMPTCPACVDAAEKSAVWTNEQVDANERAAEELGKRMVMGKPADDEKSAVRSAPFICPGCKKEIQPDQSVFCPKHERTAGETSAAQCRTFIHGGGLLCVNCGRTQSEHR